ncbi:MAG TPA: helix-turn-helix domain-containing protein [Gaiellaceae bacterium]|jgi:AcrR family transcriptional regulator|nr:helix-turn-helix domain-containing protein [Gaiellaceae bacterium]
MSTAAARMPAAERRRAIVEAATRVFSSGSYAGATTAEIAREAGISEPILYRHFGSKRDLWFACLDAAWEEAQHALEQLIEQVSASDATDRTKARSPWKKAVMPNLWIQGVIGAGEDAEIRKRVRTHMREVHDYVADLVRQQQEAGRVPQDRDANAEAWIFVAGGLLRSFADRLGGVLTDADLAAIGRERRRWLSGAT